MAQFSYEIKVTVVPNPVRAGSRATLRAELSDVRGEVKGVYAFFPDYGLMDAFSREKENTFVLRREVSCLTPPGTYKVRVYARDVDGNKGKTVIIPVEVVC